MHVLQNISKAVASFIKRSLEIGTLVYRTLDRNRSNFDLSKTTTAAYISVLDGCFWLGGGDWICG